MVQLVLGEVNETAIVKVDFNSTMVQLVPL